MNAKQARTLAIKLFGLYAGLRVVFAISSLIAMVIMYFTERADESPEFVTYSTANMIGSTITYAIMFAIYAFVAWLFLAKTDVIADYLFSDTADNGTTVESYQGPYSLAFFITLIAIFYAVPAAAQVITGVVHFLINLVGVETYYAYFMFWQELIILVIALVILNWTRPLEKDLTGQNKVEEEDIVQKETSD